MRPKERNSPERQAFLDTYAKKGLEEAQRNFVARAQKYRREVLQSVLDEIKQEIEKESLPIREE